MTENSKPDDMEPVASPEPSDVKQDGMTFWPDGSESVQTPISIFDKLFKLERFIPSYLKPKIGFLASFKNRILVSALFVVTGVV
ncbi:MAG: hypothetical protein ACP5U1_01145, partial [Desulfomonilaceae bacterium]